MFDAVLMLNAATPLSSCGFMGTTQNGTSLGNSLGLFRIPVHDSGMYHQPCLSISSR